MADRVVHGTQAETGAMRTLETLPVNELPKGEPAQADDVSRAAAEERGSFGPKNKRSVWGGRAHRGKPRMVERIALSPPGEELPTRRYHIAAKSLVQATSAVLSATVGGGALDPHVGYLVTAAGRAAKWANYFSDLAERLPPGSKEQRETVVAALGADEKASSHIRNAHEYAAKMATIRKAVAEGDQPKVVREVKAAIEASGTVVEEDCDAG